MERKFALDKHGMTLIEVLIVILIVGILATIAVPLYGTLMAQTKDKKMMTELRNLAVAIGIYKVDYDSVPDVATASELVELLRSTVGKGSPLKDTDPWGNSYSYIRNMTTNAYTLQCLGKDGVVGERASESSFNVNNDTIVVDGVFVASHQGAASVAH